jgi:hypothetical protein
MKGPNGMDDPVMIGSKIERKKKKNVIIERSSPKINLNLQDSSKVIELIPKVKLEKK